MELTTLSTTALLSTLDSAWTAGNHALAKMLAYLGEVERRGLHVEMACSSMWVFIERRFALSGGSVHRRLTAARLVRRFPVILSRIEQGDIHLEALCALKDVLTEENVDDVMRRAAKRTLAEVEHIVACLAPKPDVSARVRTLPQKLPQNVLPKANAELPENLFAAAPPRHEPVRARIEQLAETRHKVQLTVSSETHAKLERARDLMKHRNPSGDLEVVFDRAIDALLEKLEKERLAKTSRPQKKSRPSKPGEIPAVRREVFARDGEKCAHVDAEGRLCGCTSWLELDHLIPRARGGADEASNLRVACRAHNRFAAEQAFGKDYVASRIAEAKAARRAHRQHFRSGGSSVPPPAAKPRRRDHASR